MARLDRVKRLALGWLLLGLAGAALAQTGAAAPSVGGASLPLVIGQGALLHAGGKIYHTSRVVAIHDQSDDMVRFETLNSNYCLSMAPFPLAACNPLPMVSLAACA